MTVIGALYQVATRRIQSLTTWRRLEDKGLVISNHAGLSVLQQLLVFFLFRFAMPCTVIAVGFWVSGMVATRPNLALTRVFYVLAPSVWVVHP